MKRILIHFALSIGLILSFTSCGNSSETDFPSIEEPVHHETQIEKGQDSEDQAAETPEQTTSEQEQSTTQQDQTSANSSLDFDGSSYAEMGQGTFSIVTQSGSSLEGSIPSIFVQSTTAFTQIGYDCTGADGSHLTYIYIDGMSNQSAQLSEAQGTLSLTGNLLTKGIHKVEFVQYDTDSTDGNVIMYKSSAYEVK